MNWHWLNQLVLILKIILVEAGPHMGYSPVSGIRFTGFGQCITRQICTTQTSANLSKNGNIYFSKLLHNYTETSL